jgi:alginate O-acetyltransferase complex protein AlgI
MLFNSLHFLIFLPVVVILYYLIPSRYRWILLLVASCYFYMAFIPVYILVLFLIIIIDYTSALLIEKSTGRRRKLYLICSLASNVALLAFFKYFNFLSENLSQLFSLLGSDLRMPALDIILPIGLSFHTFQSMSYTIEVYRGRQKAERHLGYFADYVLFFPQMVAGPIERYEHLGNELHEKHSATYENFSQGFRLILFGLFIKMAIADNLAPYVNEIYADPLKHSSGEVLAAVFLFSFQIYADFFGYSTIAVGSARLLGINIIDNFKTPYLSRSISEFWTRWHISLSGWFRDYLYIPLGGNRVKLPRWSLNILLVFMVSGLWHGASWTFVVWGALHGIMLLLERYSTMLLNYRIPPQWNFFSAMLAIKTFIVTTFIWIFFRAESFANARDVIKAMICNREMPATAGSPVVPLAFAGVMILFDLMLYNSRFDRRFAAFPAPARWAMYALILFGLMALSGAQKFAFIYFQF